MNKKQKKTVKTISIIGIIIESIIIGVLIILNVIGKVNVTLIQWVWLGIFLYILAVTWYFTTEKKKNNEND